MGALILHRGLLQAGVDSHLLVTSCSRSEPLPDKVSVLVDNFTKRVLNNLLVRGERLFQRDKSFNRISLYSLGAIGGWAARSNLVREADIVHLHWICGAMMSISSVGSLRDKHVVWTLRDMWPFTGGCHYSLDCNRFTTGCGKCPLLHSHTEFDRTSWAMRRKIRSYKKIASLHPIGISPWIAKMASLSPVFSDRPIRWIWNGIDQSEFTYLDRDSARAELGLPQDAPCYAIGAYRITDGYKGFAMARKVLGRIAEGCNGKGANILCFGHGASELDTPGVNLIDFGYVKDKRILNRIYAASDCFLMTSKQEAFGKTVAEALSSGSPVICFDTGGPKDMIIHGRNGYKVSPFDTNAFGDFAVSTYGKNDLLERQEIRETAADFCHKRAAVRYRDLYESFDAVG